MKKPLRLALLALFFLSGASSLVFETLWQRLMTLEFGASAPATTAILCSFFVGIGLGAQIGGRLLERFKRALTFYWLLEFGIAAFGVAVPLLLELSHLVYGAAATQVGSDVVFGFTFRFVLAVLSTLPATLCMGATIPTMNRLLAEQRRDIGAGVAAAFGVNTVGAVLGCLAAGVVLLPWLGVSRSLWLAGSINTSIALCVLALSRLQAFSPVSATDAENGESTVALGARHPRLLALAYFFSGAIALGYEVVWIRVLSIYSTSSWLTFSIVLSVYLAGFGLGSLLLFPLLSKRLTSAAVFALSNVGAGIATLCLIPLAYFFPSILQHLIVDSSRKDLLSLTDVAGVAAVEFAQSFVLVFLPSMLLGLAYPAVCRAAAATLEETGRVSGRLYFLGNLGSVLGVLLVGLFLIPTWGLAATLSQLVAASLVIGIVVVIAEGLASAKNKRVMTVIFALAIGGLALFALVNKPFLNFHENENAKLLQYRAGTSGVVMVVDEQTAEAGHEGVISVDGIRVSGSGYAAMIDAKLLAHIPLLLHPKPERALTVGFGIGGTSYSLTRHPIQAECVEIEPEVVRCAPLFRLQNFDVLQHPRFRLILNDARDHLRTTSARYDVISTDVTGLRYKRNASLYTLEYFRLMKSCLTGDGVACAWIPMSGITKQEFKMLLRTFGAAFPHASLWYMNHTITRFAILVGTPQPTVIDLQRFKHAFAHPAIAADLRAVGVEDPLQMAHFLHLNEQGFHAVAGTGILHTDDYPALEFSSPSSDYRVRELFARNLECVLPHQVRDYHGLLRGCDESDLKILGEYTVASHQMTEAIFKYCQSQFAPNNREAATLCREAVELCRLSLGKFRNGASRLHVFNEIHLALHHTLQTANLAPPPPNFLEDDLDTKMTLPLFPQIGRSQPEDPRLEMQWRLHMQQLARASRYVRGAGRKASTALELAAINGPELVGYFSPVPVRANRSYQVSCWIRAENEQYQRDFEAGLIALEFDQQLLTGDQPPRFVLREHLAARHGPTTYQGKGEWAKSSIEFRTGSRGQMIHVVLYLKCNAPNQRVWFDELSVRLVE